MKQLNLASAPAEAVQTACGYHLGKIADNCQRCGMPTNSQAHLNHCGE